MNKLGQNFNASKVLRNIAKRCGGDAASNQRTRLLAALRELGSVSTIDARRYLDIMAPAPRVMELRRMGVRIETVWIRQQTDLGKLHKVGLYLLKVSK